MRRLAERPAATHRFLRSLPPAGSGGDGLWAGLRSRLDPATIRPKLADDIEIKEFPLRWGNSYAVIGNPRDLVHYKLDPEELAILRMMDGTRTIKEVVLERFEKSGDLELSRVADLVETLHQGNFFEERFLDARGALRDALDPASTTRRKLRGFATTLTIEWMGAHRFVAWIHRWFTRFLFPKPVAFAGLVLSALGIAAFLSIGGSGRFSITGESVAIGALVLLALDYLMVFVHELGHASVLVHRGRRIRSAGFQIYFGSPAFFVDSSDGLMMDKKHQILESFAGPYAQLLLGAIASITAWAFPDWILSETFYRFCVINYLVLFMNLIPLLELDGYWILSDVIQVPDLRPRSLEFVQHDLWSRIRRRTKLTGQETGLALYGIAGIAFTIFSFYTSYFYWQTIFGDFVGALWRSGTGGRALLVVLAVFILNPIVRGAIRLARAAARKLRGFWRSIRFRFEQGWRVEAAELIDALQLFDDVPVSVLNDLAGRVALHRVDRGRAVVRRGDRADAFYVVRNGALAVVDDDPTTGTERTIRTLGRGEAFGELGLVEAAPRRATVRALEPSEVFRIDKSAFDRLLADSVRLPEFEPTLAALGELRALPAFATLEPDELGEVLASGEWVNLAPGTDVLRQGDPGDAFYAIGRGQVEIVKDGAVVDTLGTGAYFGEVALLLDVPRTATVRTVTPVRAFRLSREGFDRLLARAFQRGTLDPTAAVARAQHH